MACLASLPRRAWQACASGQDATSAAAPRSAADIASVALDAAGAAEFAQTGGGPGSDAAGGLADGSLGGQGDSIDGSALAAAGPDAATADSSPADAAPADEGSGSGDAGAAPADSATGDATPFRRRESPQKARTGAPASKGSAQCSTYGIKLADRCCEPPAAELDAAAAAVGGSLTEVLDLAATRNCNASRRIALKRAAGQTKAPASTLATKEAARRELQSMPTTIWQPDLGQDSLRTCLRVTMPSLVELCCASTSTRRNCNGAASSKR